MEEKRSSSAILLWPFALVVLYAFGAKELWMYVGTTIVFLAMALFELWPDKF